MQGAPVITSLSKHSNLTSHPVAVVTGGGSGIGLAICQRLHDDGFSLIVIDRQEPASPLPERCDFIKADLLDETTVESTLHSLSLVDVNVLVNNAGVALLGSCESIGKEALRSSMRLNVEVPLLLMQAVVSSMKRAQNGRIINIASRAALGKPLRSAYSASKAGLIGMTRTWALELGQHGITANCIAPGPIATDMFLRGNPPDSESTKALLRSIPAGRMGKADDIANAVSFLADRRSDFITGQTLYVCGGLSIGSSSA